MADPTRPEPQKIDPTRPGSKIFDPDPSLISFGFAQHSSKRDKRR